MPNVIDAPATMILRTCLPTELVEQYEALALTANRPFDEVLEKVLQRALDWSDAAYVIDQVGDKEIRRMLGGKIDSQAKLLDMIGRLLTVHVGGIKVELRTSVQEQIYWSLKSMGKEGDKAAAGELIAQAVAEKFRV